MRVSTCCRNSSWLRWAAALPAAPQGSIDARVRPACGSSMSVSPLAFTVMIRLVASRPRMNSIIPRRTSCTWSPMVGPRPPGDHRVHEPLVIASARPSTRPSASCALLTLPPCALPPPCGEVLRRPGGLSRFSQAHLDAAPWSTGGHPGWLWTAHTTRPRTTWAPPRWMTHRHCPVGCHAEPCRIKRVGEPPRHGSPCRSHVIPPPTPTVTRRRHADHPPTRRIHLISQMIHRSCPSRAWARHPARQRALHVAASVRPSWTGSPRVRGRTHPSSRARVAISVARVRRPCPI